jgi:hypothetical protein
MHPLYLAGKIVDSAGLVMHLSSSIAKQDIIRFQDVAAKARADTVLAIKNLERAREDLEIERNKAEKISMARLTQDLELILNDEKHPYNNAMADPTARSVASTPTGTTKDTMRKNDQTSQR